PKEIVATAWEIDAQLTAELDQTFTHCRQVCRAEGIRFAGDIRRADFIGDSCRAIQSNLFSAEALRFDLAILNPPYRKLSSASVERARLSAIGIETSNLYAAFLWLAVNLLDEGGQLIAITPRSYMNGSYFRPFRAALLREMRFDRIHVYEKRDTAFSGDDVLQENAIISAHKGGAQDPITVTTSEGPDDEGFSSSTLSLSQFVRPDDPDQVMHVVADDHDAEIGQQMRSLPATLEELGVSVSTGRIVEFRARQRLRELASNGDVPMIFPRHIHDGFIVWPLQAKGKADAIAPRSEEDPDLLPSGWYLIVKRFSAKEEKRRVVAALFDPCRIAAERIGFDNKLNVLHRNGGGLPEAVAKGLAVFLNSTMADAYFRQFSGHTQVNATDLRSLRFPDEQTLKRLGEHLDGHMPGEDIINQILQEEVPDMAKGIRAVAAKRKVEATIGVLKALNAPKAQCNERSALTLLTLLDLAPTADWSSSSDPRRGVTEIMDWMAATYRKKYAPNTRETIRRFTLHQLIVMGLVILNPDDPSRPPNSPKNVYQIEPSALELLRTFGTDEWTKNLSEYLASMQGRNRLREGQESCQEFRFDCRMGARFNFPAAGRTSSLKRSSSNSRLDSRRAVI
ncbi:MAG TPA: Eco57I restriction-modification methylase domain-containing protein, partial [Tepidisphaeraceae bacterium]|nr:Eco57I restriction-modification methylase domain-containing protein [Tepidisphaeraceae bacterium]